MKKGYYLKIAGCLFILSIFSLSCSKKDDSSINARISDFVGKVLISGSADIKTGRAIIFGDIIETGEKSSCDILINEKNILKINQNTRLVFNISSESNVLQVETGWFAAITKQPFTKQMHYIIKSPTLVAAVRGTSFCMKVENPQSTYFCVCNGSIELKEPDDKTGDIVVSAHHSARRYIKGKDGKITIEKNPGLLYHNDQGIEDMAKKINVTIDWKQPDNK
ncbi:MAG: FecR family protein [Spirochaetota bacterium]